MKKKVMFAIAIVMMLGSIRAMAMSESEALDRNALTKTMAVEASVCMNCHTDTKIAAMQIDDMKLMIEDIIQMQERADILFGEDGTPRVGHLYKLASEADVIYMNANSSTSAEEIHNSWMAVKSLKKSACGLVEGYAGCK